MNYYKERLISHGADFLTQKEVAEAGYLFFLHTMGLIGSDQVYAAFKVLSVDLNPGIKNGDLQLRRRKQVLSATRWDLLSRSETYERRMVFLKLLLSQVSDKKMVKRFCEASGFKDMAKLYMRLLRDPDGKLLVKKAFDSFKDRKAVADFTVNFDTIRLQCERDFKTSQVEKVARACVRDKLMFIVKSERMSFDDMLNELLERAVLYYYNLRPYKSRLHAINYAKAAIRSRTLQIIAENTRDGQARLYANGDGFLNRFEEYIPGKDYGFVERYLEEQDSEDGWVEKEEFIDSLETALLKRA